MTPAPGTFALCLVACLLLAGGAGACVTPDPSSGPSTLALARGGSGTVEITYTNNLARTVNATFEVIRPRCAQPTGIDVRPVNASVAPGQAVRLVVAASAGPDAGAGDYHHTIRVMDNGLFRTEVGTLVVTLRVGQAAPDTGVVVGVLIVMLIAVAGALGMRGGMRGRRRHGPEPEAGKVSRTPDSPGGARGGDGGGSAP